LRRYSFDDVICSFTVAGINNVDFSFPIPSFFRPTVLNAVKDNNDLVRLSVSVFGKPGD